LRWLYDEQYELETDAGDLARQLQRQSFGYHSLRGRVSFAWPLLIQKRNWKVDSALLMRVWQEWRSTNVW
jgi:hypothetical protein